MARLELAPRVAQDFERIRAHLEAHQSASGEDRAHELSQILDRIHADFHQSVLTLRDPLLVIQAEHNGGNPSGDDQRRARQAVVAALDRLEPLLTGLEADIPPMLELLRRP